MEDQPNTHRASDVTLEFVIIVGFFGIMAALMYQVVPNENKSAFDQLTGALILVFGLVAKSLWDRRGQGAIITQKAIDNAQNSVPASAIPSPPAVERAVREGAAEGTELGVDRALGTMPPDRAEPAAPDTSSGKGIIE